MQLLDIHLSMLSLLINNANYKPSKLNEFLLIRDNKEKKEKQHLTGKEAEIDAMIKANAKLYNK